MNKKVSTLVAALMAAGALVLPKDVFAQVAYANGLNYEKVDAVNPSYQGYSGDYYLVFHEGEKDYVAIVNAKNELEAIDFDKATEENVITLVNNRGSYSIKSGENELKWSGAYGPITDVIDKWEIDQEANYWTGITSLSISGETRNKKYIQLLETNFSFGDKETSFEAKIVKKDAIKKQANVTDPIAANTQVASGNTFILFWGEKVLEGQTDGTAELVAPYNETDKAQVWKLDIYNATSGKARFVNVETGKVLLTDDGKDEVTIQLNGDKTNGWALPSSLTLEGVNGDMSINLGATQVAGVNGFELNQHFNGKGFNFAVDKPLADVAVDCDLFGGDTRVFAFTVDKDYPLTKTVSGGKEVVIPKGTYFFSDPVFVNGIGATDVTKPEDIDWYSSTLIAISSVTASEATDSDRRNGEGFDLIEVPFSQFDFQGDAQKVPQGDDMSIKNACFTVTKDYNEKYALNATIYYQKESDYKGTDEQTPKTVHLAVESYGKTSQRLVSQVEGNEYVFKLAATSVQDGRLLLNDTKTAAVYTIKVVSGPKGYEALTDKYLTVGRDDHYFGPDDFQWEVKGAAIYDESYPIFQWVITDVERIDADSKKYQEVTFTNRETGESFTTMLFPEGGDMQFSLTKTLKDVVPFTVEAGAQNTYEVKAEAAKDINSDVIVELKKVEVDPYAGFYNVEDGTIRTMAFARDKNDTSNKLFASVTANKLNADGEFVNDVANAAQWQLMKVDSAQISRVFAYNKAATESVDIAPEGDKIIAYTYALRYIEDGTETDYFLKNWNKTTWFNDRSLAKVTGIEESKDLEDNANFKSINFVIKENVDGSVSIIDADKAFLNKSHYAGIRVADADEVKSVEVEVSGNKYVYNFEAEAIYESESGTNDIRTFLDPEHVEISWPAEEGHVTLMSARGNYITMNEDRDGIIVNETVADTYYLYVTDKDAVVPSFYITKGVAAENGERMYLFNPTDSAAYYVTPEGKYSRIYQWNEDHTKVMFKPGIINETRDTLTLTVKGEADKKVAMKADDTDKNIWGGLNRFKWQIIEAEDAEGLYYIRQPKAGNNANDLAIGENEIYLSNWNDQLTWSNKTNALLFEIENAEAPTANEGVSATEVKVIATNGAVNIKNAAGKNVVISTILGQIVANEILTSDNATISVPAGIAIVSVDGETAVKVSVR